MQDFVRNIACLTKNPTKLVIIGTVFVCLLIFIQFFPFSSNESSFTASPLTPTPFVNIEAQINNNSSSTNHLDAEASSVQLTSQEKLLPNGILTLPTPTGFTGQTGILIVTSDLDSVWTSISYPEINGEETTTLASSANFTPFVLYNLPAGNYEITAVKDNYAYSTFGISISVGKVTRLKIHLDLIPQ